MKCKIIYDHKFDKTLFVHVAGLVTNAFAMNE